MQECKIPIFINGVFVESIPDYDSDTHYLYFIGCNKVICKRVQLVCNNYPISLYMGEMDKKSFEKYFSCAVNDYARV